MILLSTGSLSIPSYARIASQWGAAPSTEGVFVVFYLADLSTVILLSTCSLSITLWVRGTSRYSCSTYY
jgi:hypothetical protein